MKILIDKIEIGDRIRKEVTKIDELAENIRRHGLITPIAVMRLDGGEYQLLAGLRRIRAMEQLSETEIEAHVSDAVDAEEALRVEYSENDQREDFTYSENMDYASVIEKIVAEKAMERKAAGGIEAWRGRSKSDEKLPDTCPEAMKSEDRETRNIVGAKIGMSGRQYDRAKYVAKRATPEEIDQLDNKDTTVGEIYKKIRTKEKADKVTSEPELKPKTPTVPPVRHLSNDEYFVKMQAQEDEYNRKRNEYESLLPEDKIEVLQLQVKEANARAGDAESKLARQIELRNNDIYHYESTIEMQKSRIENLISRITELESLLSEEDENDLRS